MTGTTDFEDDRDISTIVRAATLDPSDTFRQALRERIRSAPTSNVPALPVSDSHDRRTWPMIAAAAVVALVVIGAVLLIGRSDDGAIELDPADEPVRTALGGDDLYDELAERRWLAVERFDDPSPTVLTSDVTFVGSVDRPEIVAHDGCNAYGGTFRFNGTAIASDDFAGDGEACGIDVLTLTEGQHIEMVEGESSFFLLASDGGQLARFTALDMLEPATGSDLSGVRHVDRLESVEFNATGRGVANLCTPLTWRQQDDRVVVELAQPDQSSCGGIELDPSRVATRIRELTIDGATVYRSPTGLLLVGDIGAIELRDLPTADIRAGGVTIGAGALFGILPGIGVSPDDVIAAVSPTLGSPDRDTGWLDYRNAEAPMQTCGLNEYREIAWGDLVTGFWGSGSRTVLLFWRVGDQRMTGQTTPDLDSPGEASGLTTDDGVGIGDNIDMIPDRFNVVGLDGHGDAVFEPGTEVQRFIVMTQNPGGTSGNLESATFGGAYLVIDGVVAAFGAETSSC